MDELDRTTKASPSLSAPAGFYGTAAVTRKGKERTIAILHAARDLLAEEGYAGLSLRAVARRAGMRLANLQHYYATREHLLDGLLHFIAYSYDEVYTRLWDGKATPAQRLTALVEYLLQDTRNPTTNRLFFEIWSLAQRNESAARLIDWMYGHHRGNLETLIASISPDMPATVRSHRAALIAMQVEGLMILLAAAMPDHPELRGIEAECVRQIQRLTMWEEGRDSVPS